MRDYLAGRPKDKHGAHEYSFADLELDPVVERERFARYQRHFSVPEEPSLDERTTSTGWQAVRRPPRRARRAITEPPFPTTDADHDRGAASPRAADRVLVGVVGRAPGPAGTDVPAPERPRPAVGRPERRQHLPPRPRRTPRSRYRIVGRMHSCDDFILAIRRNFMHMEGSGTIAELSAHDLGLGPGDDFEILLGGDGDEPNRVPLPDGALSVSIREYYFDWQPREPATFTIECLDADGPPGPFTVRRPRRSGSTKRRPTCTVRSRTGTSTCSTRAPASATTSSAAATTSSAGSTRRSTRSASSTSRPTRRSSSSATSPHSRYWSFHLYNLAWWEALEYAARVTTPQPHADPHQRRRPHPGRGRARRPGGAELARHRGPPRGAAHAAVVLARRAIRRRRRPAS